MTTVGYGDKAPTTVAGRIVALVWMFTAIIIISTFTGMIASALTTERLAGAITGPADLATATVGSISGSASDEWLSDARIAFRSRESVSDGLEAVATGEVDAFVYDAPLIQYLVNESFQTELTVLPEIFGRQDYGIALPDGSELREPVNRALLEYLESDAWAEGRLTYLGEAD